MKILYFDCFSGICGDMCLGAFVDSGVDMEILARELGRLHLTGYKLISKKVNRGGINSTKVDVIIEETGANRKARKWTDIEEIIKSSELSDKLTDKGLILFRRIFEVEGKIHGEPFDKVHLHELSAVDCLVDIFGTLIALELLSIEKVYTSKINLGSGFINSSHGILPVPAPATLELIKGYPVYSSGINYELTTPTGALIISGLNAISSSLPNMVIHSIGYGAGNRDFKESANVLRVIIGEEVSPKSQNVNDDTITVIETNIDDMNPQFYDDVMNRLFDAGALDVTLENIIMKKGRPAMKLSVFVQNNYFDSIADVLFNHTTTIGIRFYKVKRKTLQREIKSIMTSIGEIRVKISYLNNKIVNATPEYEDLLIISKQKGLPLKKLSSLIISEISEKNIINI